jgi:acetyl-CoA C-acetyltransferase
VAGAFKGEIVPIEVTLPDDTKEMHTIDEGIPFDVTLKGISSVKLLTG